MSSISFDTPITVNDFNSRSLSTFQNNSQSKCCVIDRKSNKLYVAAAFTFGIVIIWQSDNNGYSWSKLATIIASDYAPTTRLAYFLNYLRTNKNEGAALQLINIEDSDYILLIMPAYCDSYPIAGIVPGMTSTYTFIHKTTGAKTVRVPFYLGAGSDQAYPLMSGGNMISQADLSKIFTVYKNSTENLSVQELQTIPLVANGDAYGLSAPTSYKNSNFGMTGIIAKLDCAQNDRYLHIVGNTRNEEQITYCRYDKSTGTFDNQFNLETSGNYAIDPSIESDGLNNLLCVYGMRATSTASSGIISGSITSPNYPADYGANCNFSQTFTQPGNTFSFHFSEFVTNTPTDKLWFTDSNDVQISKFYASLADSAPNSGYIYSSGVAFETSGIYVSDGIIKMKFTSNSILNEGKWNMDKYYWNNIGATIAADTLRYKINNGTWSNSGTISTPSSTTSYIDSTTGSGTFNLSLIGLKEGGFLLSSLFNSGIYTNVYIKHLPYSGTTYNTTEPWYKANSHSGNIVGLQFFRYSDSNLIYKGNGQDVRIAYQIGSGTNQYGNDYLKSKLFQERLGNTVYNSNLTSGTIVSNNNDYYAAGTTGVITERYMNAFDKIGINTQILKYTAQAGANGLGKATFNIPEEFNTVILIDPLSYDFPTISESTDANFDTIIERDIRKIFFKPNFYMSRDHILNDGGFIRRNIWTLFYMGNEYEISQIVPKLINNQICFYEANVYVIGPSNDPFSSLTLPSET